ncbi:MAG: acyl-CoA dehydrogenase family protein [Bacteroidales bacterium]|jgi:alkylation response protein AidB-like acyl-CoA dehydrogenase|nr:acyl-CoA dehydrogenase family protein [Bacteroidales bacterium]MCB9027990.1 acyl-CoA dehydrogenase family protein [Bacteroidales bacterium]NLD63923.1 acyl-CoA dehydrogenase [Bacteroidales bacterium]HOO66389.1 acyl-CoA dehydrogenase family protein [Bacteroidales bacterium]HPE22495.1 acyl-CoA dehydrogenase family protein [Bacteroidales bacterium]
MANFYTDNRDLRFHLTHPAMEKIVRLKEMDYREKDQYDYAPHDFEDAMDNYERVLEIIGAICAEVIAPNAEDVDHEGPTVTDGHVTYARGTRENHEALTRAGVIGMNFPRRYEGLNFPMVPYVMAAELVSRADAGFANIWGLQDCGETILEFGSEEIREEFLPRFNRGATAAMDLTEPDAGSDLQAVQLKAHYDETRGAWLLNGVKRFITNGDAEISLVLARSEEGTADGRGLSLFVYDRADGGVLVRRIENKMGIKGSPTCELVFRNAPAKLVGERRLGLIKYVMSLMNGARLGVAAQAVGIAQAAWEEAARYASERKQFGKTINNFPAVYEMLTLMRVRLQAMRSLLYETARFVDTYKAWAFISAERPLTKEEREDMKNSTRLADIYTPMVKLISSEWCNRIAYDAVQIHGGAGFIRDFPVERLYRDARITSIYEGTSQLQVVAAIRGVTTGGCLTQIREYEKAPVRPEMEHLKKELISLTNEYEKIVAQVIAAGNNELTDFHARRLVEMAANIIMGYLLLHDAQRDQAFSQAVEIFLPQAVTENRMRLEFIATFEEKELGLYKVN